MVGIPPARPSYSCPCSAKPEDGGSLETDSPSSGLTHGACLEIRSLLIFAALVCHPLVGRGTHDWP
jgi:hypothetical protein